jgi:hypothetical protein
MIMGDKVMLLCSNCKNQIGSEQTENDKSFPAYTVIGGLVGTLGAAVTGTLLLVPATFIAGAFADSLTRRCEICDSEIEENDPGYHLMEELGDELSGRSYRPVGKSNPEAQQPLQQGSQPAQRVHEGGHSDSLNTPEQFDNPQEQCELTFDEVEGRLVRQQPSSEEKADDLSLSDGFGDEFSMGFETKRSLSLDDDISADFADPFADFKDDRPLDVNPFGLIDEPPVGEL